MARKTGDLAIRIDRCAGKAILSSKQEEFVKLLINTIDISAVSLSSNKFLKHELSDKGPRVTEADSGVVGSRSPYTTISTLNIMLSYIEEN